MMRIQLKILGFTLIELMVTISILAIVLAIAGPNLMALVNNSRVKSVTENMAQDLVMARTEAIRLNQPIRLDVRNTCYGMTSNSSGCNCTITDTLSTSYCAIKQVTTNSNIELTVDTGHFDALIFDSVRGMPVTATFGSLSSAQNIKISNSNYATKIKLNIIGNLCISSPSGSKKLAGYPDAC